MSDNKLTPGKNILWESSRMMLPEHKERLIEHRRQHLNAKRRPVLDAQEAELLSRVIADSMYNDKTIVLKLYNGVGERLISGKIIKIDKQSEELKIVSDTRQERVKLADVIDAGYA